MAVADDDLLEKVQSLGDLDLAALLCLISREHCIVSTEPDALDDLIAELHLVAAQTIGLRSVVVDCSPHTTLEDLAAAIQLPLPASTPRSSSPLLRTREPGSYFPTPHHGNAGAHLQQHAHTHGRASPSLRAISPLSGAASHNPPPPPPPPPPATAVAPQIANVVLAKNLDTTPKAVQIQCLELLRTRRIFTRTSVLACPKQFLFVAVLQQAGGDQGGARQQPRLTPHLNDFFYIAHWHDPEDGFAHLDDEQFEDADDGGESSDASVVRRTPTPTMDFSAVAWPQPTPDPLFKEADLATLAQLARAVHLDVDVRRYQMNIVAFLRLHRAVAPGCASPQATTHFGALVKALAALHGLEFVTPNLVALAARKVYRHRIIIVEPARERSVQWGSRVRAVKQLLEGVKPEDVVEDVLAMVAPPV